MNRRKPQSSTPLGKLRRFLRTGPLWSWRLTGPIPDAVQADCPDFRPGNPNMAREIYLGRYRFAGTEIQATGPELFGSATGTSGWRRTLHGFSWLRHLAASDDALASTNARALIGDWIATCMSDVTAPCWDADIAVERLMNLLRHMPFVLRNSNQAFYRRYCVLITRHVRFLRIIARGMDMSVQLLRCRLALAAGFKAIRASSATQSRAFRRLAIALESEILPDGGCQTRNPDDIATLLHDLLSLRHQLMSREEAVPDPITRAIDRLAPALRALRHADGSVAAFNGGGLIEANSIDALLNAAAPQGAPAALWRHSGYDRLAAGGTVVIADTGLPPDAHHDGCHHAGLSAIEMSSDGALFIINTGADRLADASRARVVRATSAHSTASIDDRSSADIAIRPHRGGSFACSLSVAPSDRMREEWSSTNFEGWRLDHDGFAGLGVTHERGCRLALDGNRIDGYDRFLPTASGEQFTKSHEIVVRFHLHPDVSASKDDETGKIAIWLPDRPGIGWLFTAEENTARLEKSMQFSAPGGPLSCQVIVISKTIPAATAIAWHFTRVIDQDSIN